MSLFLRIKQWALIFFCSVISFCAFAGDSSAISEKTQSVFPFSSGEILHYKLSYRGLLTSMIWAVLADVRMTYLNDKKTPDNQNAYQFELFLSTERYSKAEMFQPVRYTYTTTLDSTLQRTVLIEEIDVGENQSHDFLWLDWQNKETQLFKKREKEQEHYGFLGMDIREVWEKDGMQSVPDFLGNFPLLADQQTYLIHKESGDKIEFSQILDPLSLIYTLRSQGFDSDSSTGQGREKIFSIAVSDDIRQYHVIQLSQEEISINGKVYQGIKYQIQTDEKKENYYYVWFSNDKKKIPLRMAMDAPLGKLEIDLIAVTQLEND